MHEKYWSQKADCLEQCANITFCKQYVKLVMEDSRCFEWCWVNKLYLGPKCLNGMTSYNRFTNSCESLEDSRWPATVQNGENIRKLQKAVRSECQMVETAAGKLDSSFTILSMDPKMHCICQLIIPRIEQYDWTRISGELINAVMIHTFSKRCHMLWHLVFMIPEVNNNPP